MHVAQIATLLLTLTPPLRPIHRHTAPSHGAEEITILFEDPAPTSPTLLPNSHDRTCKDRPFYTPSALTVLPCPLWVSGNTRTSEAMASEKGTTTFIAINSGYALYNGSLNFPVSGGPVFGP